MNTWEWKASKTDSLEGSSPNIVKSCEEREEVIKTTHCKDAPDKLLSLPPIITKNHQDPTPEQIWQSGAC